MGGETATKTKAAREAKGFDFSAFLKMVDSIPELRRLPPDVHEVPLREMLQNVGNKYSGKKYSELRQYHERFRQAFEEAYAKMLCAKHRVRRTGDVEKDIKAVYEKLGYNTARTWKDFSKQSEKFATAMLAQAMECAYMSSFGDVNKVTFGGVLNIGEEDMEMVSRELNRALGISKNDLKLAFSKDEQLEFDAALERIPKGRIPLTFRTLGETKTGLYLEVKWPSFVNASRPYAFKVTKVRAKG